MLEVSDSTFGNRAPIQLGTPHIDRPFDLFLPEELKHLSICWKRGRLATLLSGMSAQANSMPKSMLDSIKGTIKTTKLIVIPLFSNH